MKYKIASGIASRRDCITVIAFPDDGTNAWDYDYSQIAYYDVSADESEDWSNITNEWYAISQCMSYQSIFHESEGLVRAYIDLGREGEVTVWIPSRKKTIDEFIPDAGLYKSWSKKYGYVLCVKEIGQHLYVCGDNNQVYRRSDSGIWEHIDQGILKEFSSDTWTFLSDINGLSEDDIYAVGYKGSIYHYTGRGWTVVPHNAGEEKLSKIKIISKDIVYIVGDNGTILKGNCRDGFKDLSSLMHIQHYTDIEFFDGVLYLASNKGMFILDYATDEVRKYKTDLVTDLQDTHKLSAKDGVLWSIGIKDIAWFDGKSWTRVDIPGNPKI